MAQPGNFTPILLYSSSTPTNVPSAGNLTNSATGSEIAINIADKNLFFKDSTNAVNTVPIRQSNTSSNGWLSNTDWNTFNNKAPATSGTSILYGNGSGGFSNVTIGSGITFAGGTLSATGSGGTITSVTGTSPVVSSGGTTPAISLATAYGDTLNPYASKTANYVLAAPNGSAGVPTFRALVAADLPSLSSVYIPYTGASSAVDLNAQTLTNIAHLGINTTSVPTILIRAIGDNNSGSRIAMRGYSSNASSSAIRVTKFRGTFASPQAPLSGDSLGKFELAGYGTTSSDGYPQASYEGVATENWGATARGTKTLFYVTPNTTITQAVALTIDQDKSATFASTVTATSFSGSGSSLTGVVTSVTGTSPVVSSGGTTPAISMPAATTSVSGYLTNTDWNTFNGKSNTNGTVTSVAALTLGTTGTDLSSTVANGTTTPVITLNVPTASAANRGALSAADWTTFNNKGSGTVTSVGITAPSIFTVGGSPVTGSGTLALTYSGTALPVANGGTGLTSLTANYIPYGNGTGAFSSTSALQFNGSILGIGSAPSNWLANSNGVQFLNYGSIWNTNDPTIQVSVNGYFSAGSNWLYLSNGPATNYYQYNGFHIWRYAASGTAGNVISWAAAMQIGSTGGVSIGNTTDPGVGNLLVNGSIRSSTQVISVNGTASTPAFTSIGETNAGMFFGDDGIASWVAFSAGGTQWLKVIGSTGAIQMNAYGVGSATFNASGIISSVSDETYKIKDGVIEDPFPMLLALETGYYYGKPEANMGPGRQLGFYAQNVRAAIGEEAAPTPETYTTIDKDGNEIIKSKPWGYYDRSVLAVVVEALKKDHLVIQEQQAIIIDLTNRLTKAGL